MLTITLAVAARAGTGSFNCPTDPCTGDCDVPQDLNVSTAEVVTGISIGLGRTDPAACPAVHPDGDLPTIRDLVCSVRNSLTRCGQDPDPTATPTPSITPTVTLTPTGVLPTATETGTPTNTPTQGPAICGNEIVEAGEECDDGSFCTNVGEVVQCASNAECSMGQECSPSGFCVCRSAEECPSGQACSADGFCFLPCTGSEQCPSGGECRPASGDGCAFNCTRETRRPGNLIPCANPNDPGCSGSRVQGQQLGADVTLRGTTALITGEMREEAVMGPDGQVLTNPGEVPVVIKATDVVFEPATVLNFICACVRPVPNVVFGPGNSGAGVVGCGTAGLTDVDFLIEQDHNTTPGSPGNGGGFVDDPNCDREVVTRGVASQSCLEGTDPECTGERFAHPGVCNSPREISFSGDMAPRGAILIFNSTAILQLGGACDLSAPAPGTPECDALEARSYGPDCRPCTRDDTAEVIVNVTPTTSGRARTAILDFNNRAGIRFDDSVMCQGNPCKSEEMGEPVDCDMLEGTSNLGGVLATAFPGLDGAGIQDALTTTTLSAE